LHPVQGFMSQALRVQCMVPAVAEAASSLERLVAAVAESPKYRAVCNDLVRAIGERELAKRRSLKEAVKATKNALHQVGGAYQTRAIDYAAALAELKEARHPPDPARWRELCARLMAHHASTRERLAILDQFYTTALAGLPPICSVLDLACGLNPLSIAWMPLASDAEYHACDIYGDMVEFLNEYLPLAGVQGSAEVTDLTQGCSDRRVDLALLLKTLPCLEQLDAGVGHRLLERIQANHILVSFPVHSLGGRSKGMVTNYEVRFMELVQGRDWLVSRFEFGAELAFLIRK
jgi:16S rRNA (guanine(1405)-N(7))-methyltransferase